MPQGIDKVIRGILKYHKSPKRLETVSLCGAGFRGLQIHF